MESYFSKERKRKTSKPEDEAWNVLNQLYIYVEDRTQKISKKKKLVYAFKNEILVLRKKDFTFWITKNGKVFRMHL